MRRALKEEKKNSAFFRTEFLTNEKVGPAFPGTSERMMEEEPATVVPTKTATTTSRSAVPVCRMGGGRFSKVGKSTRL